MSDTRMRDANWIVRSSGEGGVDSVEHAILATLMDIRERLDVLKCWEFREIPRTLRTIRKNTTRRRRRAPK